MSLPSPPPSASPAGHEYGTIRTTRIPHPLAAGIAVARGLAFPVFVVALLGAGAWQCVAAGSRVNGDAISYLDLADQYARGDWSAFQNGWWSPLYPALLGVLLRASGASAATGHDVIVAYALNVAVLGAATATFAWWLRELGRGRPPGANGSGDALAARLRIAAWVVFAWHMLRLLGIATITPDGVVAACWYAAMALLTRRWRGADSLRDAVAFGALLGIGYLAKAVLLPIGVVFAATYLVANVASPGAPRWRRVAILVVGTFAAVSAPLIAAQSARAGRLSFGETGRLAYAWYVNRVPHPEVARADDSTATPGLALPLRSMPGALLYPDSTHGSFPYWYDASRWSPGARTSFDLPAQVGILRNSARWYRLVARQPLLLVLGIFLTGLAGGERGRRPTLLLIGPIALMAIYALVHPEGRLAGPGIAASLVVLLASSSRPARADWLRAQRLCVAALVLLLGGRTTRELRDAAVGGDRWADRSVARALRAAGARPGSSVAVVGDPYGHLWARMAGVHIVAVIPAAATPDVIAPVVHDACAAGWRIAAVMSEKAGALPAGTTVAGGWGVWPAPPCR